MSALLSSKVWLITSQFSWRETRNYAQLQNLPKVCLIISCACKWFVPTSPVIIIPGCALFLCESCAQAVNWKNKLISQNSLSKRDVIKTELCIITALFKECLDECFKVKAAVMVMECIGESQYAVGHDQKCFPPLATCSGYTSAKVLLFWFGVGYFVCFFQIDI